MGWLWAGDWRGRARDAVRFLGEWLGGVPWEFALLVVGLNLLGLCQGGEAVVTLVPVGGIVDGPEFFVE